MKTKKRTKAETMEVTVVYPWTGDFHDDEITEQFGVESHGSGCGFGERDMQFTLPKTFETIQTLQRMQQNLDVRVQVIPDCFLCPSCSEWSALGYGDARRRIFKCPKCKTKTKISSREKSS